MVKYSADAVVTFWCITHFVGDDIQTPLELIGNSVNILITNRKEGDSERNEPMFAVNLAQRPHVVIDVMNAFTTLPIEIEVQPDREVVKLLDDLAPDVSWGIRKIAAEKLGRMRNPEALSGLLEALPADPFWMGRCAIIQALERIGDPGAIPILQVVARKDSFQVVRSYAAKAIERLS